MRRRLGAESIAGLLLLLAACALFLLGIRAVRDDPPPPRRASTPTLEAGPASPASRGPMGLNTRGYNYAQQTSPGRRAVEFDAKPPRR